MDSPRAPRQRYGPLTVGGRTRFLISSALGVAAGLATWLSASTWFYGLLVVVIVTAVVFVVWTLITLWPMDGTQTREHVLTEDVDRTLSDLIVLLIMASSLTVVGFLLFRGSSGTALVTAGLAIFAVLAVWTLLHTLYSTRYARIFYQDNHGGIDFNSDDPPSYQDFFYFGFNLGMTYQVSDTAVRSTRIRSVVLRHCLMSYAFGTMVLACTINLVVSLAGQ